MKFTSQIPGLFLAVAIIASGLVCPSANAADFVLDNSHASLVFGVSHLGYSSTYGRFNTVNGDFSYDKDQPLASQFRFTIDCNSIDTNDAKRDEHLKAADFFDVKRFPKITFVSTDVQQMDGVLQVTGNMTMRGKTKQVTMPLEYVGEGEGPYGNYRLGFNSQFLLKRSEFGMNNMVPKIGDDISITFSFEGIRK